MANVYTDKGTEKTVDVIDTAQTFYIGWGTGTNAAAKGDTDLQTARAEARVSATKSQPAADTLRFVAQITAAGSTAAITEAGVFDGAGAGSPPSGANLWIRSVFSVLNLAIGDSITFTINLQFT